MVPKGAELVSPQLAMLKEASFRIWCRRCRTLPKGAIDAVLCVLPRDVRTFTFCQLMDVSRIEPLKVSHF